MWHHDHNQCRSSTFLAANEYRYRNFIRHLYAEVVLSVSWEVTCIFCSCLSATIDGEVVRTIYGWVVCSQSSTSMAVRSIVLYCIVRNTTGRKSQYICWFTVSIHTKYKTNKIRRSQTKPDNNRQSHNTCMYKTLTAAATCTAVQGFFRFPPGRCIVVEKK